MKTWSRLFLPSSAVALGIALLLPDMASAATTASGGGKSDFSPQDQARIGQIAEDYLAAHPDKLGEAMGTYLAAHPEFLVVASQNLQERQEAAKQQAYTTAALQNQAELLSADSPSVGPKDAKAAVVMFFDYQCVYCSKMAPVVEALVKANPNVRFVFKEFPIFASRWPVSGFAALTGESIWQSKGSEAYITYHNALYATGHVEGDLTEDDVRKAASPYLSAATLKTLADSELSTLDKQAKTSKAAMALAKNEKLAQAMQFSGTPAFVVMPQASGPAKDTVTVLPGSVAQTDLQQAIDKARGK